MTICKYIHLVAQKVNGYIPSSPRVSHHLEVESKQHYNMILEEVTNKKQSSQSETLRF